MKVILLKNINKLGKSGDIIEVKDGYGKNFLIKNGLAKIASKTALKQRDQQLAKIREKNKKLKEKALTILNKLKSEKFVFKKKKTPKGETFGSISQKDILEKIEEKYPEVKNLEIEINISQPFKNFGDFQIEILLLKSEKGKINIRIDEEK